MRAIANKSVVFLKENLILPFLLIFQLTAVSTNAQCLADCDALKGRDTGFYAVSNFSRNIPKIHIKIHPNPNPRQFTLKFDVPTTRDLVVKITDTRGIEVYREELPQFKGFYLEQINLTHLPEGDYIVVVEYMNSSQTRRMVTY